jgi:hypothetical protein
MPSKVDIANRALRKVGGNRIASFTDGTPNANIILDIYDELVDDLLRYPWNFATKRIKLAQSSTNPVFEFDHAYALPADWILTVSAHGDEIGDATILYREEQSAGQNVLVTSCDEVWLRYVSRVTDPNLMSGDFRAALTSALARELAIPVASSNTLRDALETEAGKAMGKARSTDALGSFPERRPRGSWATSRESWRTGSDFNN